MRKLVAVIAIVLVSLLLVACAGQSANGNLTDVGSNQNAAQQYEPASQSHSSGSDTRKELGDLLLTINDEAVPVIWEDNVAVGALREQAADAPITVRMSMYGGNEQVGSLGKSYPTDNAQTTTHCGDIVLYSGSNIVVFYGSNDWSYTRLGKMDLPDSKVKEMLSNGDVTLTLSLETK